MQIKSYFLFEQKVLLHFKGKRQTIQKLKETISSKLQNKNNLDIKERYHYTTFKGIFSRL